MVTVEPVGAHTTRIRATPAMGTVSAVATARGALMTTRTALDAQVQGVTAHTVTAAKSVFSTRQRNPVATESAAGFLALTGYSFQK
jgi:hypothetical protein